MIRAKDVLGAIQQTKTPIDEGLIDILKMIGQKIKAGFLKLITGKIGKPKELTPEQQKRADEMKPGLRSVVTYRMVPPPGLTFPNYASACFRVNFLPILRREDPNLSPMLCWRWCGTFMEDLLEFVDDNNVVGGAAEEPLSVWFLIDFGSPNSKEVDAFIAKLKAVIAKRCDVSSSVFEFKIVKPKKAGDNWTYPLPDGTEIEIQKAA